MPLNDTHFREEYDDYDESVLTSHTTIQTNIITKYMAVPLYYYIKTFMIYCISPWLYIAFPYQKRANVK